MNPSQESSALTNSTLDQEVIRKKNATFLSGPFTKEALPSAKALIQVRGKTPKDAF
jgi:hypothetical protein